MTTQMSMARRASLVGVLCALTVTVLTACSSDESDEETAGPSATSARSYVGTVEGTAAFVAAVADGSRVLAYVCDGVPGEPVGTSPTIQAWFNASSTGETVDVTQAGNRLQLKLTATDMTGTVTLAGGRQLSVTGKAAAGDAGLYRAEATGTNATGVAGWILGTNGDQRGGFSGEGGTLPKISGTRVLNLSQPTFTVQGLATARIAKVGITPIPIP